jgi:hypothetical protein
MGRVVSMDGWLRRHGERHDDRDEDDVARLERAVARLEPLLGPTQARGSRVDLETELLAVSGAVSMGRYGDAARRAEHLADRLSAPRTQPG